MAKVIFVSGPCGCGKSTFADKYARHLVNTERKSVYVIHGDDFHQGFVEPEDKDGFFVNGEASDIVQWEEILQFNWDCIISTAERVLKKGLDVVIDYVIETEFDRVRDLATRYNADFYYIVLTASESEIEKRIRARGDVDMIERSLFLKKELEAMPENQGHLLDNSNKAPEETVEEMDLNCYLVK